MKKLMLLGGSRYLLPVIDAAKKLGCYTITCDYLPDNIAHKYSDEYCNISIIDKEAVLKKAEELSIDGIMSFACDPGVVTAAYVAEKLGLPSAGSYESVSILQNKGKFRKFLKDNGFNVPNAKSYSSFDEFIKDKEMFRWPVIVKPVDSAGSKGVTKVEDASEAKKSFEYAMQFSHCGQVIVEDFLEMKGHSSDADSFSVNGELKVMSISAQYFDKDAENPYTPSAYCWPCTISKNHCEELRSELQRLLTLLGMKSSIYNVEVRECTDGKAYIMEVSPRGGGNRLAEMLKYSTSVDLITNAVKAALGEQIDDIEDKPIDGYWAEIILHSTEKGIFDSLCISDYIKGNVIEEDLWITRGTKVGGFSGANEAIGTLVLKFDDEQQMNKVLDNQENHVKIILKE